MRPAARALPLLLLALPLAMLGACARTGSPAAPPPGLLAASDLPPGLGRCPGSGDMAAYLQSLRLSSPGAFEATAHGWQAAQDQGARAAGVALYADRPGDCRLLQDVSADPARRPRLAFSLVYRFGDPAAAAAAYRASSVAAGGDLDQTLHGSATGLGANATTVSRRNGDRTYFLAFWQRGRFALDFFAINLDPAAARRTAGLLDARAAQQPKM